MSDSRDKSIVLLSGGLDSVVSMACAFTRSEIILALTFDYGQRAAAREIAAAHACCRIFGVPHRVLRLDWLADITRSALVDTSVALPRVDESQLDTMDPTTMKAVWVPNRNGLFIHIAAAFAEALGAHSLITGFNREEGRTFPDNSAAFVEALNRGLALSTLTAVQVISYTQNLTKSEIVLMGLDKGAPLDVVYSCYGGDEPMCGHCESCARLKRAFLSTGQWPIIRHRFQSSAGDQEGNRSGGPGRPEG
jgi:7-cyano-7-deazaguanine synthase